MTEAKQSRCRYCNGTGKIKVMVGGTTGHPTWKSMRCQHPKQMHHA